MGLPYRQPLFKALHASRNRKSHIAFPFRCWVRVNISLKNFHLIDVWWEKDYLHGSFVALIFVVWISWESISTWWTPYSCWYQLAPIKKTNPKRIRSLVASTRKILTLSWTGIKVSPSGLVLRRQKVKKETGYRPTQKSYSRLPRRNVTSTIKHKHVL